MKKFDQNLEGKKKTYATFEPGDILSFVLFSLLLYATLGVPNLIFFIYPAKDIILESRFCFQKNFFFFLKKRANNKHHDRHRRKTRR